MGLRKLLTTNLLHDLPTHYKLAIIYNGTFLTYPLFDARFDITRTYDLFILKKKSAESAESASNPSPQRYLQRSAPILPRRAFSGYDHEWISWPTN
jgi:hypothetical protein